MPSRKKTGFNHENEKWFFYAKHLLIWYQNPFLYKIIKIFTKKVSLKKKKEKKIIAVADFLCPKAGEKYDGKLELRHTNTEPYIVTIWKVSQGNWKIAIDSGAAEIVLEDCSINVGECLFQRYYRYLWPRCALRSS